MSVSFVVKKVFSDQAMLLMTTDDDDFPSTMSADAVRKYFVKETRWTKRMKSPGKNGHPGEPRKRERFGQKLGIKMKRMCTPGKLKTRKGDLGKKGYPGGLKPERAVQAKEGLKRTTVSGMIVCASVKTSRLISDRDRSESSCSENRKCGKS
jgi:hypothetical protein